MKLFDLDHNKVIINPEALLIKEFSDIWEKDSSKDKKNAKEDLAYIYFLCDYKSTYRNFDESIREKKILEQVISRKDWKKTDLINKGVERYKELHKTYSMGLLDDVEYGLSKIRKYFREEADGIEDAEDKGKVVDKYITNAEKVQKLIGTLKALKDIVEKEINETRRVRGGGQLGNRELPKNKR